MSNLLEHLWVSWLNSDGWRRFAKRGAGARLFQSAAYRKLNMARRFVLTYYRIRQQPVLFADVKTFCIFIGHAKSGGTLLGSLLDAHPDIILADETGVLRHVTSGFSRDQIYHLLLKASHREALKGRVTARRLTPYSFAVPGQWQGHYRKLRVIGDSRAGPTTGRLRREPELLERLQEIMGGVDTKFIQVIRNPYDPISLMMVRGERSFANAINHYFDYCHTLMALRQRLDPSNLFAVRYEDIISRPEKILADLCRFLGVEPEDGYLAACATILYDEPEQSRRIVTWEQQWIEAVAQKIDQVDFLKGYRFDTR